MKFNAIQIATLGLVGALVAGCTGPAVGDPCTPEQIPPNGGFNPAEAYVETSSVQCETRVCLVYRLSGDPRCVGHSIDSQCPTPESIPMASEVEKRIYCTCRCDAPNDSFATCECPDDYACVSVLELGGPGVEGSYCVKKGT